MYPSFHPYVPACALKVFYLDRGMRGWTPLTRTAAIGDARFTKELGENNTEDTLYIIYMKWFCYDP